MLRYLIICIVYVVSSTHQAHEVNWRKSHFYGQFIESIQVNHSRSISFSWSWMKGNPNIMVYNSDDVVVTATQENGALKLDAQIKEGNSASSNKNGSEQTMFLTLIAFFLACFGYRIEFRGIIILSAFLLVFCFACEPLSPESNETGIHINVPIEYVKTICVNQNECFPVTCQLSFTSKFSSIPSNNRKVFKDNYCNIKKPEVWDEWVFYHFKTNVSTEGFYFGDSDNDGLINLIEFYGDENFFESNTTTNATKRSEISIGFLGSNPLNSDSDNDLLLDGFEYYNGMPPKTPNDQAADDDSDGLTNLNEQIHGTNPRNADTDGDGVSDGQEIIQHTDPNNPLETILSAEDESLFAMVKLTVGDPSGSHSERYTLNVGSISHQSPGFGLVGSGVYKFSKGVYEITVNHVATNLETPDYDYTASVEKVSGQAIVTVYDPQGLLGLHHESDYDYTDGKSALLNVTAICSPSSCACQNTCEKCKAVAYCYWNTASKSCKRSVIKHVVDQLSQCSCKTCSTWYNNEKKDTRWLEEVNREFKCPCRAMLTDGEMIPIDNPCNKEWKADVSCTNPDSSGCKKYHPGASGCIRSVSHTSSGAGQQCCYGSDGNLLRAGSPGAGTPDKQYGGIFNWYDHYTEDVQSYSSCCQDCEISSYCDYYIKDVRKGDDSHCYG